MKYSFLTLILSILSVGTICAQLPDHRKDHEKPNAGKPDRKHQKHDGVPEIQGWVHIHALDTESIFYIKPTEVTLLDWTYFILDKYKVEKINSASYALALPERNEINNRYFYNIKELQALWNDSISAANLTPASVKDILTKKGVADLPVTGITLEGTKAYLNYLNITYKGTAANGIHNEFDAEYKIQDFHLSFELPTTTEYRMLLSNFTHASLDSLSYKSMLTRGYDNSFCPLFNANMSEEVTAGACPAVQPTSALVTKFGRIGKMVYPVKSYPVDQLGLYDLRGNVSEMTTTEGVGMGGGYRTSAESCTSESAQAYTRAATWLGFRPILLLKKK